MNTTKDVIQAVMAAIPKIEAENDRLDEKHGIDQTVGLDIFDEKVIERTFDENVFEKELEAQLMTFDDESLLKAEALMYYGRDRDCCTFRAKLDYLRVRRDSKAELVRTIMEKIPACGGYFAVAQRKLRSEGLSIETI